jgi:hypothetical protein
MKDIDVCHYFFLNRSVCKAYCNLVCTVKHYYFFLSLLEGEALNTVPVTSFNGLETWTFCLNVLDFRVFSQVLWLRA